jgi:uncharacterized membrane protein (DUF2068 family)
MKSHITIVAAFFIAFGLLGFVGASCLLLTLGGAGFIPFIAEGKVLPVSILAVVATIGASLILLSSIPEIIAGVALLNNKSWARYLAIILGALSILNLSAFPVSTAFGIYTLWVMLQDETEELLSSPCC